MFGALGCYFDNGGNKLEVMNDNVYVDGCLLKILGSGVDGDVYRYKDRAIKLYNSNCLVKGHLNKEEIDILCSIFTKHIVLPKEGLSNDENILGYVMEYIDLDSKKNILLEDIDKLIREIKELEEELILLGKRHFLLDDFRSENLFYNGKLYLFDSDSFIYDERVDFSYRNIELFVWYFIRDVIFSLNDSITKKESIACLRKMHYLYKSGGFYLLSDFLNNSFDSDNLYGIRLDFLDKKVKVLGRF